MASSLPVFGFATNSIAERIAGVDPAVCLSRFVDYPACFSRRSAFRSPRPTINPKFWLKDIDFSCVSPWNDSCGAQRAGTLISKRHIIFAKHFPLWKGVRIVFVDNDGGVCPCHIQATKALDKCDIMIGLLDYEVSPNIKPAKILPEDYKKYIGNGNGLPVVTINQNEEAFISTFVGFHDNPKFLSRGHLPNDKVQRTLQRPIVGGDSGNPAFFLIGDELILIYCLQMGNYGAGPALHQHRREIQQAMDELCPGYKLEAFDFSSLCTVGTDPVGTGPNGCAQIIWILR